MTTTLWPQIPDEDSSPFYYSSLSGVGALFAMCDGVAPLVPAGLEPAVLGGRTFAGLAYQRYHASYPTGDAVINELELSVLVAPAGDHDRGVELSDFLSGHDQTKQIGFFPLHVACDQEAAIAPGISIFGEPKFKAAFEIETPSWNSRRQRAWTVTVSNTGGAILSATIAVPHDSAPAALSPVTTYSVRENALIASRWQINNPTFASRAGHCEVRWVDIDHPLARDASRLLGDPEPVVMWEHRTQPVAVRFRPFYVGQAPR